MSASASNGRSTLIAEHDRQIRVLLAALLRMKGYETDQAETLTEALDKVEQRIYDVVLTDSFAMPASQRLSAARQLAQRCHPTPVGLLTGWQIDPEEAAQAGVAFVLQKPFDIDELVRRIAGRFNPRLAPEQQQQAQSYLQALNDGDWAAIRTLCTPDVGYYPLTKSVFTHERQIKGIEAYLAFAQQSRRRLPAFQIEGVVVFHHPKGLVARYVSSW